MAALKDHVNYDDMVGQEMENEYTHPTPLEDLILELSLSSAYPIGVEGAGMFRATACMQALAYRTSRMQKHELKELAYVMGPLLGLLVLDIKHPIAAKAAFGIRTLVPSKICLNRFVECDGFRIMGKVLDILLVGSIDLWTLSDSRTIVENLATVYREAARFFDQQIVLVGALRHCVRMLTLGDTTIRGIAGSVLSILASNENIVMQMFSYGAIAPVLKISRVDATEPEMLAGLGCMVQLTRIPEIAKKVVTQGAIPMLEKSLHLMQSRTPGVASSVRNKALLCMAWLSRVEEVRKELASEATFIGMERELKSGVANNQTLVLQMMINLRYCLSAHRDRYNLNVRDTVLELMSGRYIWFARNLTTKCLCLIYTTLEDKLYCAQHGALEHIFDLIKAKNLDLQEVPMVALLSFVVHPQVPFMIFERGYHLHLVNVLYAVSEVIRSIAVVLLKALMLYNRNKILEVIPADREFLMKIDPEADPVVYGAEYGGMIQEYLARIIENRREMHYLLEQFPPEIQEQQNISDEELEGFQATFMLLDYDCNGDLALDEIKVLMVLMGEKMDEEEIQLLFNEYDEDKSGVLSFGEFCVMMKNWRTRFGTGASKVYNEALQRGAIGKGRRAFARWLNQDALDAEEIRLIKQKKIEAAAEKQRQLEKFNSAERLRVQRLKEAKINEERIREMQKGSSDGLPKI